MPDSPVRVVLLARPGDARDQLRRALADFGAELVAEGDPAELDPHAVADGRPGVVVVSLEPAIEDSLERFETLLAADDVEVIYDDAEVTRQLDGWDLARWARHLAAKLAGGDVVLPPAPAGDVPEPVPAADDLEQLQSLDFALQPGAPPTPAQEMDAEKLEDYAAESLDLSAWVPTTPSLTDIATDVPVADAVDAPLADADGALELDLDLAGLEQAMTPPDGELAVPERLPPQVEADESAEFATADFSDGGFVNTDTLALADDDFATSGSLAPAGMRAPLADADAPLEFADAADSPLELADAADAPLELAEADETPLDLTDDVPLELAGAATTDDADFGSDDTLDLGLDDDLAALEESAVAAAPSPADEPVGEPALVELDLADAPLNFSSFTDPDDGVAADGGDAGIDDDVAALAAQLEAFEASDQRGVAREPDFANLSADEPTPAPERRPPAPAAAPVGATPAPAPSRGIGAGTFGSLELVPMDGEGAHAAAGAEPEPAAVLPPLKADEGRRAGLSLAEEHAVENIQSVDGALFVVAGLGGPDGVRQLLAALPPTLPAPVLLYQHLDTGKHERLVGQLAKASRLPLDLAVEGKLAFAGRVAVLQPGIGIARREQNIEFIRNDGLASVVAALPPGQSTVLVLSGADPAIIAAVLELGRAGGLVLAQDPTTCFDPAAAQAVIAAGAVSGSLPELAQKILERWN